MTLLQLWQNSLSILPEIVLSLTICLVILADMFTPLAYSRTVCGLLSMLGVGWALISVSSGYAFVHHLSIPAFDGMLISDGLGAFFKLIFLLGALATMLFSLRSRELAGLRHGEYFGLLLGATLGACFLVSSGNFILFILALETLSMCSYVLAGFLKHDRISAEASLKYMLYGAVASGVMLFGISYLYGMTGTLDIPQTMRIMAAHLNSGGAVFSPAPFLLALVLVLAGLGFKIAMVPFHFWCPDVYQGSPTPVTAFLSVVSKAAGFSALLRLLLPLFDQKLGGGGLLASSIFANTAAQLHLPVLFGVLSVVTMVLGNLVALRQTDVKRLLAYSSIAHAGYLLLGLTVYNRAAVEAVLFYFFIYMIMNLGAFWVVIVLINRLGGAEISRFRGVAYKSPFLAAMMIICLFSLTGLPPTAGFMAKLQLFQVVINAGMGAMNGDTITPQAWFYFGLALIGVLNSAVSLYYYMKIAREMALRQPEDERVLGEDGFDRLYAALFGIPSLLLLHSTPLLVLVSIFN